MDDEFYAAVARNEVETPSYVSDVLLAAPENLPSFHAADLKVAELRAELQRLHQELGKRRTALAVAHDAVLTGGVKPDQNEALRDFANSEFKYRQDVAAGKIPGKVLNKQGQIVSGGAGCMSVSWNPKGGRWPRQARVAPYSGHRQRRLRAPGPQSSVGYGASAKRPRLLGRQIPGTA